MQHKVQLTVIPNVLDQNENFHIGTDNVLDSLYDYFEGQFPDNSRLYHGSVSTKTDVTPVSGDIVRSMEQLRELEGDIFCVVYPQFFLFGLTGVFGSLLKVLLLGLLSYLLRPKPPVERNVGDQSPNNGLSERVNRARPNERVPDIYGEVRSVPDLIAKPYFRFEANQEVEYSYMCVGRGEYRIEDIKDDQTPIEDIAAVSVEVYGPYESPNKTGKTIQQSIGRAINEKVWSAVKSNAVNGQVLRAPDATLIEGNSDIAFNTPDQIVTNNQDINFESYFAVGDTITISNSLSGDPANTLDLNGVYEIFQVFNNNIVLINPGLVNSNWNTLSTFTNYSSANLSSDDEKWVGPFTVKSPWVILANYIAINGMYKDDGEEQSVITVEIETEMKQVNSQGQEILGTRQTTRRFIEGSDVLQNSRSESSFHTLTGNTSVANAKDKLWEVRARRITPTFEEKDTRFVDEVQWRDLYGLEYVDKQNFGDVTTIQVRTPATAGALAVKQRKLNCLAWRKIPSLIPGTNYSFTNYNQTNSDATLIIRHIALDPTLGNMQESDLDYDSIFAASAANRIYFGTPKCVFFAHTFDNKDLSAEEMIVAVANSMFSIPYRQGSQLKLNFEQKTDLSKLLFNHRNKIPGSEVRNVRFGASDNHDGVEFDWTDTSDGATETYQIPYDGSASNPKKIEIVGITNEIQAHMHAWREWQKIQYQNVAVEFDSTAEAAILTLNDRILVADNTRPDTNDGNIVSQTSLTLELSQPFTPESGEDYTIFIQHFDGSVESLEIGAVNDSTHVTVGSPPRLPLVLDADRYARTTYQIIKNSRVRPSAFLVKEIDPKDSYVVSMQATNYDNRFYAHDTDFLTGFFNSTSDDTIIFIENWENLNCPAGQWRLYSNPGGFTSTVDFEIQNNIVGIGPAAQGVKHGELDGTNEIYVDLATNPANTYELSLFYSPRPSVSALDNQIKVYWDGSLVHTMATDGTLNTTTVWETIELALNAPATSTTRLKFQSTQGDGVGGLLDDIKVTQIGLKPTYLRSTGDRIFRPDGVSIYRQPA